MLTHIDIWQMHTKFQVKYLNGQDHLRVYINIKTMEKGQICYSDVSSTWDSGIPIGKILKLIKRYDVKDWIHHKTVQ